MTLFEQVLASNDRVRTAGQRAIAELHAVGLSAYVVERPGGPIIELRADGSRCEMPSTKPHSEDLERKST